MVSTAAAVRHVNQYSRHPYQWIIVRHCLVLIYCSIPLLKANWFVLLATLQHSTRAYLLFFFTRRAMATPRSSHFLHSLSYVHGTFTRNVTFFFFQCSECERSATGAIQRQRQHHHHYHRHSVHCRVTLAVPCFGARLRRAASAAHLLCMSRDSLSYFVQVHVQSIWH